MSVKLSDLVQYRNNLRDISLDDGSAAVQQILGPIVHTIGSSHIEFEDFPGKLEKDLISIQENIQSFKTNLHELFDKVDKCISDLQPLYFSQSYTLYDKEMRNDSAEHVLNRRFVPSSQAHQYLTSRIQRHSQWKYPIMILRPGLEGWEEILVGADPVYLVDQSHELLNPVKSKFNADYQRRLRYYTINEENDLMLDQLPQNQLSFCLAYNFFNSKPLEIIKKYLLEVFDLLRPGGTFGFTFIDGDRPGGIRLVERNFVCYTPESMLKNLALSMGYEIDQMYHIDSANTWLEIKKPGELTSLRGGQTLAKVVAKSK